jgi:hypothetical protein
MRGRDGWKGKIPEGGVGMSMKERQYIVREGGKRGEEREGRRIPPAVRLDWPDPRMPVFGHRWRSGVDVGQPKIVRIFPTLICSQL